MSIDRVIPALRRAAAGAPLMRRAARRRVLFGATYTLLLLSCDSPLAPDEATVARLETSPLSLTMTAGETRPVTVRVLDDGGATLTNRRLFWSSQNAAIATVSQAGVVSGVAPGATQVAVSAGGKSALIPVTVNARPVSLVRVTPTTTAIVQGATTTLTAEALDASGGTVAGRPVIWATSNAAVATVTSTGVVSGVAPGTANVTATVDGVVGTAIVTVQPVPVASLTLTPATGSLIVGQSLQLTATPRDASGAALAGRAITWTSSAPASVSVSSTGLVTALSAGTATITATSEGKSATSRITASLVPIAAVSIAPGSATIAAGRTVQLVARVVDSAGTPLTGRTVTWATDQPAIATVDAAGLVTGISTGRATITATADGQSATASIDVTPVPVASVTITPGSGALLIGATLQLTATARDASNNVLPGRFITWISGAPSVASVTQGGLVTAVGSGSALIFAASEGVSTSITITVSSVGVSLVRVTPATGSVEQGKTLQLSAAAFDVNGAPVLGRAVTWNSAAASIASVSSTGLVTGIAAGTTNITATVDGVVGTAAITVSPTPVAAVSVVPNSATMTVGNTLALTLILTDAGGAPLSPAGRTITWTSATPAIASVNASGVVTAVATGATSIQATVEGVSGSAAITVTNVPVSSVTVTPSAASLNVGATQRLTATARDAGGNTLAGRAVTWTSNNPSVASVDASGLVTALSTGSAQVTATIDGVQGAATITVSTVPIASIVVTPSTASVEESKTTQLTATALDAGGNPLVGRSLTWSSSNNATASVSQTGLVTANVPGSVTITVTPSGLTAPTGSAAITVTYAPVATATILPNNLTVTVGQTTQPAVTLVSSGGQTLSPTGRTVTWSLVTTPANAATINSTTGLITGVAAGTGTITVSAASPGQTTPVTATAALTISTVQVARIAFVPVTGTLHIGSPYARVISAQTFDAGNNLLTGRLIAWSAENANITVSPSSSTNGQVTITGNNTPSSVKVIATTQGVSGPVADTITVTTDFVPIASGSTVTLAAAQADSVVPGAANVRNYTATPRDSAGNVITGAALGGRVPTWSLSAGQAFASLAPSGATAAVTPLSPGAVTVQASYGGGVAPSAALRILTPVSSISMTATPDSFFVGGNAALFVAALDAGGTSIPGRLIQLASASVPAVITIGQTSGTQTISTTVTGVSAPGGRASATITATAPLDGVSNSTSVRVLAPVSSITVTAPSDSIYVGANVQATATLRDVNGNTLSGRPVTWSTGSAAIATAAPTGVVTGVAAGSTTIVASAEAKQGTKTLLVQEPVNSVVLTASDSSISVGQTQPTVVTLLDRFANTITGRVVTYASSAPSIATVNASGVISAVAEGATNITATSEGKTSPALPITVGPAPVASVTVSATPTPNVYPSHTFPATVQAFDALNNPLSLSGRTITWSSANPAIATVTAGAPGSATITAVAVGTTTISATVDGVAAATPYTVVVKLVPVVSVTVAPSTVTQQAGTSGAFFSATALDSTGATLTGRTFTWSTSNGAKATVNSSTGVVTTVDSGTVSITATATGQGPNGSSPAASGSLTVTAIPISSVTFTPATRTLPSTNASDSLTLDVRSSTNLGLPGRACTIVSSNTGILTVTSPSPAFTNANGQIGVSVKGASAGTVTLTATCDPTSSSPVQGTATVTVP